ncbi:MAG: cyclic nucleotide-binding domain-containing protein, partial [Ilumatobacteraceae bacterium]
SLSATTLVGLTAVVLGVDNDDRPRSTLRLGDVARDSTAGLRHAIATTSVRRTIGYLTIGQVILGTLDVILVSVAFEQLGRGGGTAAMLNACLAGGAVIASVTAARFISRIRLGIVATVGGVLMSLPIVLLDRFDQLAPVVLVAAIIGVGSAFDDIGGLTLLQRVGSERMTSRVFGVLNSCSLAACAVGAMIAGTLIDNMSALTAFAIIGGVGLAFVVPCGIRLIGVDRAIETVDPARIEQLRGVPFLAPLPLPTLERLVRTSQLRSYEPGETPIVEGAVEHDFFVLIDGSFEVIKGGDVIRTGGAPDYFGEIALVRDVPRTASITATSPMSVLAIGREAFLESISLTASSRLSAETVAGSRLATAPDGQLPDGRSGRSITTTTGTSGAGVDDR